MYIYHITCLNWFSICFRRSPEQLTMGAVTSSLDTSTSNNMQSKSKTSLHMFEEIVGQEIPAEEALVRETGILLADKKVRYKLATTLNMN